MLVLDIVLVAALTGFVLAWWARTASARRLFLFLTAGVALAAGLWGVIDDRWQAGVGVGVALLFLIVTIVASIRNRKPGGAPFISGTVFALLAVAGAWTIYMFPIANLPAPSGPYSVGVRTFELSDPDRLGVFQAQDGEARRLLIRTWYPADPEEGAQRARYFSEAEADTTAHGLGQLVQFPPLLSYLKHVRTNSFEDAPLAADAASLPTVIYSHGYVSFLGQNTALMEELASHGYAVYSIQHTDDSSATVFPNGDVIPMDPALFEEREETDDTEEASSAAIQALVGVTFEERLNAHLNGRDELLARAERIVAQSTAVWLHDRIFFLDQLENGSVPQDVAEIVAASELSRTGHMGMSFGGSTAGAVCMIDARCVAGVNLDGLDYHYLAFNADMPVPFLMFHSDLNTLAQLMGAEPSGPLSSFNEFSYERFESAGMRDDIYRLQLKGAVHLGLSDFSLFMRRPVRDSMLGSAPADVLVQSQNDFVRGFFDKHLRGADNGFPQDQYAQYEDWIEPLDNSDLRAWWRSMTVQDREAIERRIEAFRPDEEFYERSR